MSKARYRQSVKTGQVGEDIATLQMKLMGLEMVDEIHTGLKLLRWVDYKSGLCYAVMQKKVRGDRAAIVPGTGQRVLAEVKTYDEPRLVWSKLAPHQHESLQENAAFGGLSLLIWVKGGEALVMDYVVLRANGFAPGKSIDYQAALAALPNLEAKRHG